MTEPHPPKISQKSERFRDTTSANVHAMTPMDMSKHLVPERREPIDAAAPRSCVPGRPWGPGRPRLQQVVAKGDNTVGGESRPSLALNLDR